MNFLIVDDNRYLNHCLSNYLQDKGHPCASLSDSSKAIRWLSMNPCDAIILDLKMPQIGGIALTTMIRKEYGAIPILIFTGLGYEEEFLQAAVAAGANGYVSKVMGPAAVLTALERISGGARATAGQLA